MIFIMVNVADLVFLLTFQPYDKIKIVGSYTTSTTSAMPLEFKIFYVDRTGFKDDKFCNVGHDLVAK
jgi:hypothetical protein